MEIEKMSDNLDKMVEKFKELREKDTKQTSRFMFLQDKKKETEAEMVRVREKLLSLGIDPENNAEEALENDYNKVAAEYMAVVNAINSNQALIEEVEKALSQE